VLGRWAFFFNFKGKPSWILPPLEPKLMVMWDNIGGALKMANSAFQFTKTWF
jgi:hypothetical protein